MSTKVQKKRLCTSRLILSASISTGFRSRKDSCNGCTDLISPLFSSVLGLIFSTSTTLGGDADRGRLCSFLSPPPSYSSSSSYPMFTFRCSCFRVVSPHPASDTRHTQGCWCCYCCCCCCCCSYCHRYCPFTINRCFLLSMILPPPISISSSLFLCFFLLFSRPSFRFLLYMIHVSTCVWLV